MSDVTTIHEKDEQGRQITTRRVTITDAAGRSFGHDFRATEDGHEYLGEGSPPESAEEALAEWLGEDAGDGEEGA